VRFGYNAVTQILFSLTKDILHCAGDYFLDRVNTLDDTVRLNLAGGIDFVVDHVLLMPHSSSTRNDKSMRDRLLVMWTKEVRQPLLPPVVGLFGPHINAVEFTSRMS
jgi:hypothetical protein